MCSDESCFWGPPLLYALSASVRQLHQARVQSIFLISPLTVELSRGPSTRGANGVLKWYVMGLATRGGGHPFPDWQAHNQTHTLLHRALV